MAPRVLTAPELQQRNLIEKWKGHHENQIDQGKVVSILKCSLTRVKNAFEEHQRLSINIINDIDDEDIKAAALEEYEAWELEEIEWQDEKNSNIQQTLNPHDAPRQVTQAEKDARYDMLHAKAKSRAENAITQIKLLNQNLAPSLTNRALDSIKQSVSQAEAEFESKLWDEYDELAQLKPDRRPNLMTEYTGFSKTLKQDTATLLGTALGLLPASPTTSTPNTSFAAPSNDNSTASSASGKPQHSYTKEKLPNFDGDYRAYPRWSRQWKDAQGYYGEDQFFLMLQKSTPADVDILANNTLEDVWTQLDARYASVRVVSEAALKEYSAFVPTRKSKNEKLIEVADHVNKTYGDLQRVGKGKEMDQVEHLILKVLEWLDTHHRDELIDMYNSDEKLAQANRKGVFKITTEYLKETRLNLLKYTPLSSIKSASNTERLPFCRSCKKNHNPPFCSKPDVRLHNHERQPAGQHPGRGGGGQSRPPRPPPPDKCGYCGKKSHSYTSAKTKQSYISTRFYDCPEFMRLSETQRAQHLEKIKGCSVCTSPNHQEADCDSSWQKCGVMIGDKKCTARHNRVLHGADSAYVLINSLEVNNVQHDEEIHDPPPVLLFIQGILLRGKFNTSILYDPGSNTSLITKELAQLLGLPYKRVGCWVTVATKAPEYIETNAYTLILPVVTNGKQWDKSVTLYEVPGEITSAPNKVNIQAAYSLFPQAPAGSLERPSARVGLLLGMDCADLMPIGGDPQIGGRVGNLVLMRTVLGGPGYVLGGSHPEIKATDCHHEPIVNSYKQAKMCDILKNLTVNTVNMFQSYGEELIKDDLGIQPPAQCGSCRSCTRCQNQDVELSKQDREVMNKVWDSLEVVDSPAGPQVHMSYPLNANYDLLVNNKMQAIARETSIERQLIKNGRLEEYNAVYQDSIDRGAMVEIHQDDIDRWLSDTSHRIHFTGHHAVLKDSSKTTPLRVVNDSKMKNSWTGPSANDVMFKGPDRLANMYEILARWRQYEVALLWDVSKAYNAVVTKPPENFIRCQVWRFGETDSPWRMFQYQRMAFGDLIASLGLELVKEKGCDIAELKGEVSQAAIDKVRRDMFVDDGVSGCQSNTEAARLIGDMSVLPNGKLNYTGEISQVLGYVGLKPKVFIQSGIDNPSEAMDKQGNVLGHIYDPSLDVITFRFQFKVKLSKGRGEESLTLDNLENLILTRRSCLAATMQIYDPLGIVSPLSISLKIASKDVTNLNQAWDVKIPDQLQELWQQLLHKLLSCPDITIPRRVRPEDTEVRPELICMYDGSESAYAAVIYIRYKLIGGPWEARIYAAKARVTPSKGMTVPRAELNSLLISTRMAVSIHRAMTTKPTRITFCGDSECTISSFEAEHTVLAAYFGNRVHECELNMEKVGIQISEEYTANRELAEADIKEETQIDKLQHLAGVLNTADIATRGHATHDDLKPGSEWLTGPKFLTQDRETWPLSRSFVHDIPEKEKKSRMFKLINACVIEAPAQDSLLEIVHRVSNYRVLRGIFARIIVAHKTKQPPARGQVLTPDDYEEADRVLLWLAMPMTHQLYIKEKLVSLSPFWKDGVLYTRGRLGSAGMTFLGPDKLPILHPKSRLAVLILKAAHEEDHRRTPAEAVYRSRKTVWIHRAKHTAQMVTNNCAWCRVNKPKFEEQRMADLPSQIFEIPSSPWTNITMDFMAPVMVKGVANKRTQIKCFPLLIVCMNVQAATVRLVPGYDTENLLIQLQTHISVRGQMKFIYTDSGSQMKAAKETIEDGFKPVDWDEVKRKTAASGVVWKIAPPESQWRDGRSERMVQALKQTVKHIHNHRDMLNFVEMQALYDKCCDAINDRPLGVHHHNGEAPSYSPITPNLLLKGARSQLPTVDLTGLSTNHSKYTKILTHMDTLFMAWWHGFEAQVFDSLAPYPKWRKPKRNLMPEDICVLRYDHKLSKPEYRLCEVTDTEEDDKGDVRTVEVVMRPRDVREKKLPYIVKPNKPHRVPIQRLALLYSKRFEADESGESLMWPCLPVPNPVMNSKCSRSQGEKSDSK